MEYRFIIFSKIGPEVQATLSKMVVGQNHPLVQTDEVIQTLYAPADLRPWA